MRNFYYIQTYNLMNPGIRSMLSKLGIIELHNSLTELTVRSKYFLGYSEVLQHAQIDFKQKLPKLFPPLENPKDPNENAIKVINIMNPKFAMVQTDDEQSWDENCCGTMFFCNASYPLDEDDEFPHAWIMKYEVFFEDDVIELSPKNGEHAFDPFQVAYQSFSSVLH